MRVGTYSLECGIVVVDVGERGGEKQPSGGRERKVQRGV